MEMDASLEMVWTKCERHTDKRQQGNYESF